MYNSVHREGSQCSHCCCVSHNLSSVPQRCTTTYRRLTLQPLLCPRRRDVQLRTPRRLSDIAATAAVSFMPQRCTTTYTEKAHSAATAAVSRPGHTLRCKTTGGSQCSHCDVQQQETPSQCIHCWSERCTPGDSITMQPLLMCLPGHRDVQLQE